MKRSYQDLETYSPVPIKSGTHKYAEKAEILLWSYALDDGEPDCWDVTTGARMPNALEDQIEDERIIIVGQNWGMFDEVIIEHVMPEVAKKIPLTRVYDTLVQALSHSLPGSLDKLCEIFNIADDERKLKTGKDLIRLFCMPPAKNVKRGRATRLTHPAQWEEFIYYAKRDIPSMRAVHKKMPHVNYRIDGGFERELWLLDQKINRRGFLVDIDLAEAAVRAVEKEQKVLAARTKELTNDERKRRNAISS